MAVLLAGVLLAARADAADLAAATRLPMRADSLRKSGVSPQDVATILEAARQQGMAPGDALGILQATEEAVRSGGKGTVDDLGGFVRAQIEAGLRGPELSAAIKAEKAKNTSAEH